MRMGHDTYMYTCTRYVHDFRCAFLRTPARQDLIQSLERAQRSRPKRCGHEGQHEGLVYMSVTNRGQVVTLCEVAGPAPRVRSMTVHNIPVR